jgi:hypothetical protein
VRRVSFSKYLSTPEDKEDKEQSPEQQEQHPQEMPMPMTTISSSPLREHLHLLAFQMTSID